MRWADIPFKPSTRTLRQFGGLWLLFFGALALWQYVRHGNVGLALLLLGLAATAGLLGLIKPGALRWLFVGSICVTFPIGWLFSHVLLGILFYLVLTPMAFVFCLIGRDALARGYRADEDSYWSTKQTGGDMRSYFRQS